MDSEEYRKNIERKIINVIEEKLLSNKVDANRVREIAIYIYETLIPHLKIDLIYKIAKDLDKHFPELLEVSLYVEKDYDNKVRDIISAKASLLIKSNKALEAKELLDKALNKEIKLSDLD